MRALILLAACLLGFYCLDGTAQDTTVEAIAAKAETAAPNDLKTVAAQCHDALESLPVPELSRSLTLVTFLGKHGDHFDSDLDAIVNQQPTTFGKALVLRRGAILYRDRIKDRGRERETLEHALANVVQARAELVTLKMEIEFQLAEVNVDQNREESRRLLREVCATFDPSDAVAPEVIDRRKQIYVSAAIRLLELTPDNQVKDLEFYPFVYGSLINLYPDKAKALNGQIPGVPVFRKKLYTWLDHSRKHDVRDPELRKSFDHVIEHLESKSRKAPN